MNIFKIEGFWTLLFFVYWAVAWIVNLIKFIGCDFEAPYKEEVIHAIGVFFAVPSLITVWF